MSILVSTSKLMKEVSFLLPSEPKITKATDEDVNQTEKFLKKDKSSDEKVNILIKKQMTDLSKSDSSSSKKNSKPPLPLPPLQLSSLIKKELEKNKDPQNFWKGEPNPTIEINLLNSSSSSSTARARLYPGDGYAEGLQDNDLKIVEKTFNELKTEFLNKSENLEKATLILVNIKELINGLLSQIKGFFEFDPFSTIEKLKKDLEGRFVESSRAQDICDRINTLLKQQIALEATL